MSTTKVVSKRSGTIEIAEFLEIVDGETRTAYPDVVWTTKEAREIALAILNATWSEDDEIEERAWGMAVHASDAQDVRF